MHAQKQKYWADALPNLKKKHNSAITLSAGC